MVRRAHGAYSDAAKWIKLARPSGLSRSGFASRCFQNSFIAGVVVLGLIGLASPSTFGQSRGFSAGGKIGGLGLGWPALLVVGLVLLGLVHAFVHREGIRWTITRMIDPWRRPMSEHPTYEGAVGALEECPDALRTRFAWKFVYRPLVFAVLASFFAFSAAYFLIDAVLAQFSVGWEQPVLAAVNVVLSVLLWRASARGLSTWRLAASVHKAATTGYA